MASADNALAFVSTGYADCVFDSGSDIDNLSAFTWCGWIYLNSANANGAIANKSSSSVGWTIKAVNGNIDAYVGRATVNAEVYDYNNHIIGTANKWYFVAVVLNLLGADGDQHIYVGDLSTAAAETPSYFKQTVGSGAQSDDQYQSYSIGRAASTQSISGRIAYPHLIGVALTLSEIQAIQYAIAPIASTLRLHEPGAGGLDVATAYTGYGSDGTLGGSTLPTWAAGPGSPVTYGAAAVVDLIAPPLPSLVPVHRASLY